MKKTIAALLCVLLLAVPASAASTDALSLYRAAAKKTNAATSMQIRGTIKTAYQDTLLVFQYTLRQRVNDSGKLEAQMLITGRDFDFDASCYYRDGYVYCDGYGGKIKTKMSEKDAAFSMFASPVESWFDGVRVQPVDSGGQLRIVVPSKRITGLMGGVFQTGVDGVTSATRILPYSPVRITNTVTVGDDGYLRRQTLTYADHNGSYPVQYTFDMKFSGFDEVGAFPFPADLDTYSLQT